MRKSWRIDRRTFLRGIGSTLALPALDIMESEAAAASAVKGTPPTRFVTIFQPNGFHSSGWDVNGVGKNFELSRILKPLQPFKKDMIVLSNIDNPGNGHIPNTAAFLTAAPPIIVEREATVGPPSTMVEVSVRRYWTRSTGTPSS